MNERIRALAEQADIPTRYVTSTGEIDKNGQIVCVPNWDTVDPRVLKFAELIVQECVTKMASEIMNNSWIDDAVKNTYKHFGVE